MDSEVEAKLKPTMLDPSLLCTVDFWEETRNLRRIFRTIYFPESIKQMRNIELRKFYGGYLHEEKILAVGEVAKRCQEYFRSFSWEKYSDEMPELFRVGFGNLRRGLEKTYLAKPIQNALLDEFVFLTTQSSILSRMKKIFRVFEKFNAIPLLNLEKRAPEEWKATVRGIKKAVTLVNWIAVPVVFSIFMGPVSGFFATKAVKGIRLLLVDPAPNDLAFFQ